MKKLLLLIAGITATTFLQAKVLYVKPDAGSTAWAHVTNQSDVYSSIGSAHNAAVAGDDIWISAGAYNINSITMKDGIDLMGGFNGTETSPSQRVKSDMDGNGMTEAWEYTNTSVIKGNGTQRIISSSGTYINGVTWEGLTIKNGGGSKSGIAILLMVNTNLKNCIVKDNHGTGATGSVYAGAIQNKGGLVEHCLIENNSIISNDQSSPAVYGAGIACSKGGVVQNSVIRNNHSTVAVTATFNNNYNNLKGGGVYLSWGQVINCVVYNNESGNGAGIYINKTAGGSKVVNCTITNNKALTIAGGLYAYNLGEIYNNIIWNNLAGDGTGDTNNINLYLTDGTTSAIKFNYNAYNGGYNGDANNTASSPMKYIIDDANNGGSNPANFKTVTNFQGVANGNAAKQTEIAKTNWYLNDGSACVNQGQNAYNNLSTDIISNDRIRNATIDLGAYETQFFATAINTVEKNNSDLFFPNPATNVLNIASGVSMTEFYSVQGELVRKQPVTTPSINIADLPSGIYIIRMTMNDGSAVISKLLKR
ncbi:T9SS C-terminal target domain-containing protein [Marinilabiliaceae bacterium JC017]|nr:T9SS C-terminal target domain-containing protein [Marinilabiliaceae bacterium JC017]